MLVTHQAREQVTVAGTATNLTAATITVDTIYADIQVQTAPIRVTFDGSTTPVAATTGTLWNPGSTYRVWGQTILEALKFVADGATSAVVVANYWKRG